MSQTVRIGVIGCGGMGHNHIRKFHTVQGLSFTAACDPKQSVLDELAREYGVKTFTDGIEMMDSGEVDAVLIATPHYAHPPLAIAAMQRGLHVLCEKPIAVTAKAAQEMIDEHEKHPDLVFCGMFQQRLVPVWREVKRLIDAGEVGELRRVQWTITTWFRTQAYYDSGGWRATWEGEGGGVLINQCPHNLDLFCWFVGQPSRVTAAQVGLGKYHHIEVEDEVNALLEFDNGATGMFVTSTGEAPGVNRLEVVGEAGTIIAEPDKPVRFTRMHEGVGAFCRTTPGRFTLPGADEQTIEPGGEHPGHAGITQNFVNAILHGEKLVAPAREGILGLEFGNAMLLAGLTGQPVNLPTDREAFDQKLKDLIANSTFEKGEVRAADPGDLAGSYGT